MPDQLNTPWRLMATAIYDRSRDCRVFGHMDADVTDCLAYIRQRREEGERLTLLHLIATAFARTIAFDAPELNTFVRRGRIVARSDVGVLLPVDAGDTNLAAMVVRQAHTKTASVIAREVTERAQSKRAIAPKTDRKNTIGLVPWPFRKTVFESLRFAVHELGAKLPRLDSETFGSVIITNIGVFGLNSGYAALMPAANVPMVIAVGRAERRPVVRDEQIVIRDILPLTGTFDHRIVDGRQAGKLAKGVLGRLADPEALDREPAS